MLVCIDQNCWLLRQWCWTLRGSNLSLSPSHHPHLWGDLIMECPYIKYWTRLCCSKSHYTQHHVHFSSVTTQIYEFQMPLRKYTAVTEQGHDRRPWSIFEWKAIWEIFKAFSPPLILSVSLSPREQHQESIDCWGPVVSQRLSPLTNPLALCQPLTTVIDCYSLGHSNYTQLQSGHLFQHFHHIPKKSPLSLWPSSLFLQRKQKEGHIKFSLPPWSTMGHPLPISPIYFSLTFFLFLLSLSSLPFLFPPSLTFSLFFFLLQFSDFSTLAF